MIDVQEGALTDELKDTIQSWFQQHATSQVGGDKKFDPVTFVATEDNKVVGVIVVELFWGALHIKTLIVDEHYRGCGVGSRLMQRALLYGLDHGCSFAYVETLSFQALEFYKNMGFSLDFTRSGYAHNSSFHYLSKPLSS